jgi:hypothetical protein
MSKKCTDEENEILSVDNIFLLTFVLMKCFTLLFSLYLFALAILPCSDNNDCKYLSTTQAMFSAFDHSNHHEDIEHCTPFCICSCCGQTCCLPLLSIDFSSNIYFKLSQKIAVRQSSFLSELKDSIWQPPKIS